MNADLSVETEPPSFVLGRSAAGLWILRDRTGLQSGTFRTREAAIRFARVSTGQRHCPVTLLPEGPELGRAA
jgi:hypothetical protein